MIPPTPRPGALRETITIQRQRPLAGGDGYGNAVAASWSPVADTRAAVTPLKGVETVIASRLTGTTQYWVQVRSDDVTRTLTTTDRIVWRGQPLNVRSITNEDRRDRYLTILAEAGGAS